MKRLLLLLLIASPAIAQENWIPRGTADLALLDKIRAQPNNVSVRVGESTVIGSITVRVKSCVVRPPDQPADAAAYLDVTDTRGNSDVFHGWMLAKTPGASQMEHPVYDVRLLGCH